MKKTFVLIIFVCLLLSSCVAKIDVENSIPIKEELSDISSDVSDTSSDISEVSCEESSDVSNDDSSTVSEDSVSPSPNVPEEVINFGDFKVETEFSTYEFFSNSATGSYKTKFNSAKKSENGITITLADGRVMELQYKEVTFNENDQTHSAEINGLPFNVSEFHDSNNNICQVFECTNQSDESNDSDEQSTPSIVVKYFPELEHGEIDMAFTYNISGENVVISYPDGKDLTKTVKYNESEEKYYFE
ncbi:MAG: hypothetical protein J6Q89_06830 [Clostridia bacterium]|nr:hypothetical protein [Clostridia bacterium]